LIEAYTFSDVLTSEKVYELEALYVLGRAAACLDYAVDHVPDHDRGHHHHDADAGDRCQVVTRAAGTERRVAAR
jgi:hypothetical protein